MAPRDIRMHACALSLLETALLHAAEEDRVLAISGAAYPRCVRTLTMELLRTDDSVLGRIGDLESEGYCHSKRP